MRAVAWMLIVFGLAAPAGAAPAPGQPAPVRPVPAPAAPASPLEALAFLIGDWEAVSTGKPGEGTGKTTFARDLQDRVIRRTNHAEYPPSDTKPAVRHDDLMVIHADAGGAIKADYYDSEGHVIRYAVTVPSPGQVIFLSDVASDAPTYRLAYEAEPSGLVKGRFEVAPPGKPEAFNTYLSWEIRRVMPR